MSETESSHFSLLQKKACDLISFAENYSAISSLSSLLFHLLEPKDLTILEKPLLRLLNGSEHYKQIGLVLIAAVIEKNNTIFERNIRWFRINITDTEFCKHKKIEILKLIANESNIKWIQKELEYWIK